MRKAIVGIISVLFGGFIVFSFFRVAIDGGKFSPHLNQLIAILIGFFLIVAGVYLLKRPST